MLPKGSSLPLSIFFRDVFDEVLSNWFRSKNSTGRTPGEKKGSLQNCSCLRLHVWGIQAMSGAAKNCLINWNTLPLRPAGRCQTRTFQMTFNFYSQNSSFSCSSCIIFQVFRLQNESRNVPILTEEAAGGEEEVWITKCQLRAGSMGVETSGLYHIHKG